MLIDEAHCSPARAARGKGSLKHTRVSSRSTEMVWLRHGIAFDIRPSLNIGGPGVFGCFYFIRTTTDMLTFNLLTV